MVQAWLNTTVNLTRDPHEPFALTEVTWTRPMPLAPSGGVSVSPNEGRPGTTFGFSYTCPRRTNPNLTVTRRSGQPATEITVNLRTTMNNGTYSQGVTANTPGNYVGKVTCNGSARGQAGFVVTDDLTISFSELEPPPDSTTEQGVDLLKLASVDGIARAITRPGLPTKQRSALLGQMQSLLVKANLHTIRHSAKACAAGEKIELSGIQLFVDGQDVTPFSEISPASGPEGHSCARISYRKYWLEGAHTMRVVGKTTAGTIGQHQWTFSVKTDYALPTAYGIALDRVLGPRIKHLVSFFQYLLDPLPVS